MASELLLKPESSTFKSGLYVGRTPEWVAFHDPGWLWYIKNRDPREGSYGAIGRRVDVIWRRLTNLRIPGECLWCEKPPIARIVLSREVSGSINPGSYIASANFACDKCQPVGIRHPIVCESSFATVRHCGSQSDVQKFLDAIKWQYPYLRVSRLPQKRLERFLDDPANFTVF